MESANWTIKVWKRTKPRFKIPNRDFFETIVLVYKGSHSLSLALAVLVRRMFRISKIPFSHILSIRVKLNGVPFNLPLIRDIDSEVFYETYMDNLLGFEPDDDWLIMDIGSHVGLSTIRFSSVTKKHMPSVFAVEPNVYVLAEFVRNIKCAGLKNVNILNVALSNESGYGRLFLQKSDISNSIRSDFIRQQRNPAGSMNIRILTLPMVYEIARSKSGKSVVDLLLLDAEGEAINVLQGGSELFVNKVVQRVKIDVDKLDEIKQLVVFFSKMGYNSRIFRRSFYAWV